MKRTKSLLSILLSLCLVFSLSAAASTSTFTDAHGNVIELDDTLEAYTNVKLFGGEAAACASFMQASGVKYTVNTAAAYDRGEVYNEPWYKAASVQRVTVESVNGRPFNAAETYAVITSNANFNGMDSSYLFKAAAAENEKSAITTADVRDVIWMYIKEELGGTIDSQYAEPKKNITLKSEAPAVQPENETKPSAAQPDDGPKPSAGSTEYIVQRGDTLWGIAKKTYGSGYQWSKIYSANPQIKDPNMIYVGQKLVLPAV